MLMAIITLISGLLISGVAIFYSVAGLTSIFSAAPIPIMIMGTSLELAKLTATVWLKQHWNIAPRLLKTYLILAVGLLMIITSMGIFGFLSKAHSDQSLVSGDVQSRIAIYDQRIQTANDNIAADRKALEQMDAQVDQLLGRTTDNTGVNRAVSVRRQQARERDRLNADIAANQELIAKTNEEAAPIRAEVRKVEAEVGPLKYIAQLIYGPDTNADMLEKAVSWVIILIVIVFDPLAITLLLASQYSFTLAAEERRKRKEELHQVKEHYVAEVLKNDDFSKTFEEVRGSVDPAIDLEFDTPRNSHIQSETDTGIVEEKTPPKDVDPVAVWNSMIADLEEAVKNETAATPESSTDSSDHFDEIEKRTSEGNTVIDPERAVPETKITHTPKGMIIEDGAGKQEITTTPTASEVVVIDKDYVRVDGQVYHHKAYRPGSSSAQQVADSLKTNNSYVQNEEQQESGAWSKIAGKSITEEEYLEAARKKQDDQ